MKRNKYESGSFISIFLLLISLIVFSTSCGSADQQGQIQSDHETTSVTTRTENPKIEPDKSNDVFISDGIEEGNMSNLANDQFVLLHNGSMYYTSSDDLGKPHIYRMDAGTDMFGTIFDGYGLNLVASNGFLYFIGKEGDNVSKESSIYKMDLEDMSYELLTTGYFSWLSCTGRYLYYIESAGNNSFPYVRLDTQNGSKEVLIEDDCRYPVIYDKDIYYISSGYIYKTGMDGKNRQKAVDDWAAMFLIADDSIIYVHEGYEIKKCSMDGKEIDSVKIFKDKTIESLSVYGDYIFYIYISSFNDDAFASEYSIGCIKKDGSGDLLIYSGLSKTPKINILEGRIYVLNDYALSKEKDNIVITCMMDRDGKNFTELER